MKSFRWRLIAWTLSLFGLVLLAFGIASDMAFYRMKLATVDERLNMLAPPHLPPPGRGAFWDRLRETLGDSRQRVLDFPILLVAYSESDTETIAMEEWLGSAAALRWALPPPEGVMESTVPEPPLPPFERGPGTRWRRGGGERGPWGVNTGEPGELMTLEAGGEAFRVSLHRRPGYNVALGVSLEPVMAEVWRFRLAYAWGAPAALALLGIGAWLVASRAIKPIRKVTAAAEAVSATSLGGRIESEGEDKEFAELIGVYNRMMERLEKSFAQATRFSADAAHELKTPLTILQGNLESALQAAPDNSEQQRMLGGLVEEVLRLRSIARKLLLLAQADTGALPLKLERVDFAALLRAALEGFEGMLDETEVRLESAGEQWVEVDVSLLEQILQNLISNAVKYNVVEGAAIWLESRLDGDGGLVFEIENRCLPIAEAERGRLFERFARLDASRGRQVEGTGLGLSLAREFARALGGELELAAFAGEERMRFRLTLPGRGG